MFVVKISDNLYFVLVFEEDCYLRILNMMLSFYMLSLSDIEFKIYVNCQTKRKFLLESSIIDCNENDFSSEFLNFFNLNYSTNPFKELTTIINLETVQRFLNVKIIASEK
jgi:hypothetical protein